MPLAHRKKIAVALIAAALLIAVFLLARFHSESEESARQHLLHLAPNDATAVIFADVHALSATPFLAKLFSWAPQPTQDAEYTQFVRETGFSYERDLNRIMIAVSSHGSATSMFAIADGKFDRKKIEAFFNREGKSSQEGKWKIFRLNSTVKEKPLSFAFLSDNRIAAGDSEDFASVIAAPAADVSRAEWDVRFERLAGVPVFAVIRQDQAMQGALSSVGAGSFRSPQLSNLLAQLQWISIAGKPDGDHLRVVADGESVTPSVTTQLADFLQGVQLLAQSGLNDPKLRQKMDPQERQAYLELLKNADVQKLDRGESKSVRVVLEITPKLLDIARTASTVAPARNISAQPGPSQKTTASPEKKSRNKK
jgi:hypothetical protein